MKTLLSASLLSFYLVFTGANLDPTFDDGFGELSKDLKYEFACSSPLFLTQVKAYNFMLLYSRTSVTCWAFCFNSPITAPFCSATADVPSRIRCIHGDTEQGTSARCCQKSMFWQCLNSSCPPPAPGGGDDDRTPGNM
jgi:hypothetical protein